MVGKKNHSALLAKYFEMYKKNPRSRVFAPLAEAYRKLGLLDDAHKVLKDGIRIHPNYTLGYIVLANCFYDEQKYELTYNTLRPFVQKNADNISLQKIFAQSCIHLGHLEEALDTYKYLLFMNPRDKFFAEQVKNLEDDLLVGHRKLNLDQLIKSPEHLPVSVSPSLEDDWVRVDFNQTQNEIEQKKLEKEESTSIDQWEMKKTSELGNPVIERSLEDEFYADEFAEDGDIDEVNSSSISSDTPIISHTLIDLYCAQHYFDKAIELLEKILELNPGDISSKEKLAEVYVLKEKFVSPNELSDENDGHDELISIIENKVKIKNPQETKLEYLLNKFSSIARERAQQYR